MKQKKLYIIMGVLALLFLASLSWALASSFSANEAKAIKPEEAKNIAKEYINTNLMPEGSSVNIDINSVIKEKDLYKMDVDLGNGQIVKSYISLDGTIFFPQGFPIENQIADNPSSKPQVPTGIVKADKPKVELFVMSHCPYGTQIEKGILPVLDTLGDTIDFELKFVDYAMHGEKELQEQLRQHCIKENSPEKFNNYLGCFLAEGNAEKCITENSLNKNNLNSCIESTDEEYKVIYNFKNNINYKGSYPEFAIYKADNEKYGVGGSPTLIINESEVSSGRDSATLLATICESFNEEPAECEAQLSSSPPSAGFGYNVGAAANAAACE